MKYIGDFNSSLDLINERRGNKLYLRKLKELPLIDDEIEDGESVQYLGETTEEYENSKFYKASKDEEGNITWLPSGTDAVMERVNIWDYDAETDTVSSDEYDIHMEKAGEPEPEPVKNYITFSSPNAFNVKFPGILEGSTDGETWSKLNNGMDAANTGSGYELYVRGKNSEGFFNYQYFTLTGSNISVSGDIRNLLNYEDVDNAYIGNEAFEQLFFEASALKSAKNLILPMEMKFCCCRWMFDKCTSLEEAPKLPATTLATACYGAMFSRCTSLEEAPELPATTLAINCYLDMFKGCTKLNYVKIGAQELDTTYSSSWLDGVASTGDFYAPTGSNIPVGSTSGIPSGWTKHEY